MPIANKTHPNIVTPIFIVLMILPSGGIPSMFNILYACVQTT